MGNIKGSMLHEGRTSYDEYSSVCALLVAYGLLQKAVYTHCALCLLGNDANSDGFYSELE